MLVPRGFMYWPLLGMLVASSTVPALAQERQAMPDLPERILATVDVLLTHLIVDADGRQALPVASESAFTLQKLRTSGGATKIRLTYRAARHGETPLTPEAPLNGARVEYDLASQSTTVFDESGQRPNPRLALSAPAGAALGSFESWLEALVLKWTDAAERRQTLERTYGRPVGKVGRLARYLQNRGEVSEEVLADPVSALPVEVNLFRQNTLEGHITIQYDTLPAGHLVRRRLHSEQLIEARSGRRSILSVEFSNISVEGR